MATVGVKGLTDYKTTCYDQHAGTPVQPLDGLITHHLKQDLINLRPSTILLLLLLLLLLRQALLVARCTSCSV